MVFGIKFRIYYLLAYKTENLTGWEFDFLNSLSSFEELSEKQYNKLTQIWDTRKIKDVMAKQNMLDEMMPHDIYECQAMYGYQF